MRFVSKWIPLKQRKVRFYNSAMNIAMTTDWSDQAVRERLKKSFPPLEIVTVGKY
jgi:hypothetical protein